MVLEFEDRDAADAFVENEQQGKVRGYQVIAMFLKPKKFCECNNEKIPLGKWLKDKKYGLYVCRDCKRPSQFHNTGLIRRLQYPFGFNILPVEWEE